MNLTWPTRHPLLVLVSVSLLVTQARSTAQPATWRPLQPGVEYAAIELNLAASWKDGRLHAVRIDPKAADLRVALASENGRLPRTAAEWCRTMRLAVAINAGMYRQDGLSNVGYLRNGPHVNQAAWTPSYKAALGFGSQQPGRPTAVLVDLDEAGAREAVTEYATVIQNLRLIREIGGKGHNVWQRQDRAWSEAALAMDDGGRLLLLFCRAPLAMWDFNRRLLDLPLGIVRAMHVEGGPESSLSIHAGGVDVDLNGSYETGFHEADDVVGQLPIPNVLGVLKKP